MAGPYNSNNNQFQQNMNKMPPLQTHTQHQGQRAFSPPSYQQSPGAMSPNMGGVPPAKRQRVDGNAASPYQSPFSTGPYGNSPYGATSPSSPYLSVPPSPAMAHPAQSFNQPQPYQHPIDMNARPPQSSMPPPKLPYSKTQDNSELEKANPRDMDVNNISDVLTGSGIDLRAEEEYMTHSFGNRNLGNAFNSQASASTVSPHGSFNAWSQGASVHGAFQGTGPLSQPMSQEQQETELLRKHEQAARAYAESAQAPLTDPILHANVLRHKIASRAYENGIQVSLEGLFDRIPERPQNVTRTSMTGANGESITVLQADSLLTQNAPFVDVLSLITLAAEERLRTVLDDAFALSQARQNTSQGIVPPNLADLALANGEIRDVTVIPNNISKTAWEAPDSAISPMTVTASKQMNAARLPTPPTDAPPTPQPTIAFTNHIANALKRRVAEDYSFEKARLAKRQKRQQGSASTPTETVNVPSLPLPEKMTKKERDRINKAGQTDDVLHRKANETASMALGGKKKYSWMTGGGGGFGSGASTPRLNTAVGGTSGTSTPAQPPVDRSLQGARRQYGMNVETDGLGRRIQIRDLIHVLELDGRDKKTLLSVIARLQRSSDDDEGKPSAAR